MATKSQLIKKGKEILLQNKCFEEACPCCKRKLKIKTKELFSGKDSFSFVCDKCDNALEFVELQDFLYDTGKALENTLKDMDKSIEQSKNSDHNKVSH